MWPDIGGLPSLTLVTHQSDADKNSINLRGLQGEVVQPCQRVSSARHTASLPEMSAIIRTYTSPNSGSAKPHLIKRDNYAEGRKCTYPKLANSATPTAPGTSLYSQSSCSSGLILSTFGLGHSGPAPAISSRSLTHLRAFALAVPPNTHRASSLISSICLYPMPLS